MYANAVKQVRTTLRTQVLFTTEEVVGKLGLTVSPGTEVALGDHVFPTEKEKQDALFRTERSGSSAVEVSNTPSHEEDGIVGSNDLGAFRAGPLLLLHRFDLGGGKISRSRRGVQGIARCVVPLFRKLADASPRPDLHDR